MSQEIELKIQFNDDKDERLFFAYLSNYAKNTTKKHQRDTYFDNPQQSFIYYNEALGIKDADDFLRVREMKDKTIVCFKRYIRDDGIDNAYSNEIEYQVDSAEDAKELFNALGFVDTYEIDKIRTKYELEEFEVVVDEEKIMGKIIEIELKEEFENVADGIEKIYNLLRTVGIQTLKLRERGFMGDIFNPGYDFTRKIELS